MIQHAAPLGPMRAASPPLATVDELLEAGAQPIEWHWEGWVPKGTLQTWLGKSGIGKSWTALDLAICTCYGLDMLGHPVRQGRVLYVSAENSWQEEGRRLRLLLAGRGIEDLEPLRANFMLVKATGLELLNYKHARDDRLADMVRALRPALVVLDSASALACLDDENANAQVIQFIDGRVMPWVRETGVTVVLTHNAGKGHDKEWVGRGASAWKDKVDGAIAFWPEPKDPKVIDVWQPKVRIGTDMPPMQIRAMFEGGDAEEVIPDTSARFERVGGPLSKGAVVAGAKKRGRPPGSPHMGGNPSRQRDILDALKALGTATVPMLENASGAAHNTVTRHIQALVKEGIITVALDPVTLERVYSNAILDP